MLERTDRIGLVVADADAAAETYRRIFDTRVVGDQHDRVTAARRVTLQWGRDQVELHEPRGEGAAAEFIATGKRGLWSGGFSLADPGVEDDFTNFYHSDHFGYDGAITWFEARDRGRLDSLEYLEPTDASAAVARFVGRSGPGIYMCSIESDAIPEIKRRVEAGGPGWDGDRAAAFIHPRRLHGLLVGLVEFEAWNARRPLPGATR